MGKKLKEGEKGKASRFISRAKAIKKLSLSISDFRKICIYKGIFPRVPPNKLKAQHRTYYHVKDINYLAQDRLMDHFRAVNALRKKLKTAIVAGDARAAARIRARLPRLDLERVVRQRYPAFSLALKDMDDPLSLIALVAAVPAHRLFKLSPTRIGLSARLLRLFKAFVARKALLRKVFLSVKGVYYQAEVRGQLINWVEPYALPTVLPADVDYKVILSFLEFYLVLVKFVNFKLYSDARIVYPPTEASAPENGEENVYCGLKVIEREDGDENEVDAEFAAQMMDKPQKPSKPLFAGLVFFLSREVDKSIFEFVVRAFGGRAIWHIANFDSDAFLSNDITHVVQDRALDPAARLPNREYIQPQWLCDCANFGALLPVGEYAPGAALPPHLSPFVADAEEGYVPARKRQILAARGEYVEESLESEEEAIEEAIVAPSPVQRSEPVLVVAGTAAASSARHGSFAPSKSNYKVVRQSLNPSEEAAKEALRGRVARTEERQRQSLALNRKRRRLLDKISAAERAKRENAREMTRRAKTLS